MLLTPMWKDLVPGVESLAARRTGVALFGSVNRVLVSHHGLDRLEFEQHILVGAVEAAIGRRPT